MARIKINFMADISVFFLVDSDSRMAAGINKSKYCE